MSENQKEVEGAGEENFAELLEKSLPKRERMEEGQKVEARIVKISQEWAFLDLGGKGEGYVDRKELCDEAGNLKVREGDLVQAYFLSSRNNEMLFTVKLGTGPAGHAQLEDAWRNGVPVQGSVVKEIKGGFEVKIAGGAEQAAGAQARDLTVTVRPARPDGMAKAFRVVLLCETPDQQRLGLQGFPRLGADDAALFTYTTPTEVTFWMGSVSYPIDIIFISPDMTVSAVYSHCLPGQDTRYPSRRPISWVIETAAGSGIRPGDAVAIRGARPSGNRVGAGR